MEVELGLDLARQTCDAELLVLRVTRKLDNFETVLERQRNLMSVIGRRDEHDLREVEILL